MKKILTKLLLLYGTVPLLLLSCNLLSFDQNDIIESKLLTKEKVPEINSPTVGLVWDRNGQDTNISNMHAGYIIGTGVADPCVVKVDETYHIWYTGISTVNNSPFYTIRYAYSNDGISWKNDNPSNIVLAPSTGFADGKGVRVGAVIWDNETEEFKMWYRGKVDDGSTNDGKWHIFFARSKTPDQGWAKHPNLPGAVNEQPPKAVIIPEKDFENNDLGDLSVIKGKFYDGYRYYYCYKIWYSAYGNRTAPPEFGLLNRIMFAISDNGVNWHKTEAPVLETQAGNFDELGQVNPAVIQDLKDGSEIYKMWYLGGGLDIHKQGTLGIAYSYAGDAFEYPTKVDDTHYTVTGGIPAPEKIKEPWIIRDGYSYKMWYVQDEEIPATGGKISTIKYIESM